jgi:prepilin-type N-terminal cleavage/methylation domain-containing protein
MLQYDQQKFKLKPRTQKKLDPAALLSYYYNRGTTPASITLTEKTGIIMKRRRAGSDIDGKKGKNRAAGFTLIELMVTIVVFGILCAAAAINWSAFTRYQNLRGEANALYNELAAMKAMAIENGDTVRVTFTNTTSYTVTRREGTTWVPVKTVTLGGGVRRANTVPANWGLNGLVVAANNTINILPHNINAFQAGYVILEDNRGSNRFAIRKQNNVVKLEIWTQKGTGTWTKR